MSENFEIKKISNIITNCTRNVNTMKKLIEGMIRDLSIYETRTNILDKCVIYINNNINMLENLFPSVDSLSENKEIRKRYVVLIESSIYDFKEFRQKLDKIKTHSDDIRDLTDYLENTRI